MHLTIFCIFGLVVVATARRRFSKQPPPPRYPAAFNWPLNPTDVRSHMKGKAESGSAWERSGLFEGDIATSPDDMRNALVEPSARWPLPIPVFINRSEFDPSQVKVIESAIAEIEQKTCVKFKTYEATDPDYIVVRGNGAGCWSSVGRKTGGQVLHLQPTGCVHHGIAVHEFLHALGLYHQQSTTDRDDYVTIHWQNIKPGREHNFVKYPMGLVTAFNFTYDYGSLMHYGATAFTANGMPTITPKGRGPTIGQRLGMSSIDMGKIQVMYDCPPYDPNVTSAAAVDYDDYEQYLDLLDD